MNTVIILYNRVSIKCNLNKIKQNHTQYVLMVSRFILNTLSQEQLQYFDAIHTVNTITEQELHACVKPYIDRGDHVQLATNDESCLLSCAQVRDTFHLNPPYPNHILPFLDKNVMKTCLKKNSVPLPNYLLFDKSAYQQAPKSYLKHILTQLNLPIFAKPTQEAGAIGTIEIYTETDLQHVACQAMDTELTYELDEFLQGTLFHIDSIVSDGKILISNVFEYSTPVHNFRKGIPLSSIPWLDNHKGIEPLKALNETVLNTLPTPNGATHLEVFELSNGELVFLEVAARAAGAYVISNFEQTFGFNYEQAHFEAQLGLPIHTHLHKPKEYYCWAYLPIGRGIVTALHEPNLQSEYHLHWHVNVGDSTDGSSHVIGAQNMAGVLFWHDADYQVVYDDFKRVRKYKAATVKPQ